ncbi:hypothetical protein ACK83U_19305 (plasmid) [Rhizobium sp. WW22]|uniref:hypothetical protein n=1 Tax=unclassified Rhizobium TaxID=2613769 RepID=UPI00179D5E99|nr:MULTISPECIES: hypothetical protein [unclassified Rhizobium]MBB3386670.1 2-hydroxychromene-2-carboxylate isomerase [Rhizobium sp. BK098]MBB3618374.1 2-hydroxychromene-2-carboxylate isomerase [Rhizobium sp. BK609]MBB3684031.1 2-hydroxychromene-2-carboxylate isomerase [Rhizobium sp. BK612]
MADSENSRTLPAITPRKKHSVSGATEILPRVIDRRNLLPVAARLLSALIAESRQPRQSGPTPVREMWPRWYEYHQQHVRAIRLREKLKAELLKAAGGLPVVMLPNVGKDGVVEVRSFADINRMASQFDTEHLSQARAELRRRRKRWKEADRRLGYSAILAREQELAERAGISGRVMWITRPSSLIEVTAKLHCLIVMHDPGLKLEEAPWPELRTMLKDLLLLMEKGWPEPGNGPAYTGKAADVRGILNLAARYRDAANTLGEGLSKPNHLPRRLLALHSIKLYLDALLLANGLNRQTICSFEGNLNERTRVAMDLGLVLRKRTAAHLATLSSSREYLAVSYGSETTATLSQMNRVMATLDEVSLKVRKMLRGLHGRRDDHSRHNAS